MASKRTATGEHSAAALRGEGRLRARPPHRPGCLRVQHCRQRVRSICPPRAPPETPHFLSTTLVDAESQNEGALSSLTKKRPRSGPSLHCPGRVSEPWSSPCRDHSPSWLSGL